MKRMIWRRLCLGIWLLATSLLVFAATQESLTGKAVVVDLDGVVGPATVDHVRRTIADAGSDGANTNPAALQLRYLQTMNDMAGKNTSTLIFPLPIDLLKQFAGK